MIAEQYGQSIGNGNGEIKPGYIFEKESSWEALREGCGVVVFKSNGKTVAFGETWNSLYPYWRDYLDKNFVVAKRMYGHEAFLVVRKNGLLEWQSEEQKSRATCQRVFGIPL
ncbi:MAG: hypothetical protein ABIB72_00830 [Candidatus Falkowbacteria bacterium]